MAITQSADLITNHPVIGEVEFGIGEGKVPQTAHVAYFWETEREFADGVQDSGPGIDPENLDHLFDAFLYDQASRPGAWTWRSAARSSKGTAGGCGQHRMRNAALFFSSYCQLLPVGSENVA